MYQNDYILRQIELMTNFLYKLLHGEDLMQITDEEYEVQGKSTDQFLSETLRSMALQGQINEAENLLYEHLEEKHDKEDLTAAVEFYRLLARLDDSILEQADYSRIEIVEGLRDLCEEYITELPQDFLPSL